MNELYKTKENLRKAILVIMIIDQLGLTLDEMFWTPLRDLQVFLQKTFGKISGFNHPVIAGVLVSTSIVTNLAYLAKVFNKNKVDSLEEILHRCKDALHQNYFEADGLISDKQLTELGDYFKNDLDHKGYGYLDATVEFDQVKKNYDIQYKYSAKLSDILKSKNLTYETAIADLNKHYTGSDKQAIIEQLSKMIPDETLEDGTKLRDKKISEVEEAFFKKLHSVNPKKALLKTGKETYEFLSDVSFQFWLVFFISNMMYDNADSMEWSLTAQLVTISAAFSISAIKFGAKIVNFFKRRKEENKRDQELKAENEEAISYVNESLKHKQYESFFIRQMRKYNLEKAKRNYFPEHVLIQQDIDNVTLNEKPLYKKIRNTFFSLFSSVEEIEGVIQDEIEDKTSFVQKAESVKTAATMSIVASFIEWVAGAATYAFSKTQSVKAFLDGTQGGILGLAAFGLGAVLGVAYYNKAIKPDLEANKKALKEEYDHPVNKEKLALLKQYETENKKFRRLIKEKNNDPDFVTTYGKIEKLPVLKSYKERTFRRCTTEETKGYTYLKKSVNRGSLIIGREGTGILLVRYSLLAILAATLPAAVFMSVLWPVAVVALVVGAIWAGIFLYKYVQERRIAHAKTFLDDIDNRLEAEKDANDVYRTQFQLELRNEQFKTETQLQEAGYGAESDSEDETPRENKTQKTKPELPKIVEKQTDFFVPEPYDYDNGPGFFANPHAGTTHYKPSNCRFNAYLEEDLAHPRASASPPVSIR